MKRTLSPSKLGSFDRVGDAKSTPMTSVKSQNEGAELMQRNLAKYRSNTGDRNAKGSGPGGNLTSAGSLLIPAGSLLIQQQPRRRLLKAAAPRLQEAALRRSSRLHGTGVDARSNVICSVGDPLDSSPQIGNMSPGPLGASTVEDIKLSQEKPGPSSAANMVYNMEMQQTLLSNLLLDPQPPITCTTSPKTSNFASTSNFTFNSKPYETITSLPGQPSSTFLFFPYPDVLHRIHELVSKDAQEMTGSLCSTSGAGGGKLEDDNAKYLLASMLPGLIQTLAMEETSMQHHQAQQQKQGEGNKGQQQQVFHLLQEQQQQQQQQQQLLLLQEGKNQQSCSSLTYQQQACCSQTITTITAKTTSPTSQAAAGSPGGNCSSLQATLLAPSSSRSSCWGTPANSTAHAASTVAALAPMATTTITTPSSLAAPFSFLEAEIMEIMDVHFNVDPILDMDQPDVDAGEVALFGFVPLLPVWSEVESLAVDELMPPDVRCEDLLNLQTYAEGQCEWDVMMDGA